jgi:hypothetical protein
MITHRRPPRPRWYPVTVAALVLIVIGLGSVAALGLAPENGPVDGILGFFTGLCATLAVALVAVTEIGRRHEAELLDAAALDELEPLRAATLREGSTGPSASHTGHTGP